MLRRCFTILATLLLVTTLLQAHPCKKTGLKFQPRQETKTLRTFIEGDDRVTRTVIEEMRRRSAEFGLDITFTNKPDDPYDVRIILAADAGSQWESDPESIFKVYFYFNSAVILTPQGKTVFTLARSANTSRGAVTSLVNELLKGLQTHCSGLRGRKRRPQAGLEIISGLPNEPGVYYKSSTGWHRLGEALAAGVKTRGVGTSTDLGGSAGADRAGVRRRSSAVANLREEAHILRSRLSRRRTQCNDCTAEDG